MYQFPAEFVAGCAKVGKTRVKDGSVYIAKAKHRDESVSLDCLPDLPGGCFIYSVMADVNMGKTPSEYISTIIIRHSDAPPARPITPPVVGEGIEINEDNEFKCACGAKPFLIEVERSVGAGNCLECGRAYAIHNERLYLLDISAIEFPPEPEPVPSVTIDVTNLHSSANKPPEYIFDRNAQDRNLFIPYSAITLENEPKLRAHITGPSVRNFVSADTRNRPNTKSEVHLDNVTRPHVMSQLTYFTHNDIRCSVKTKDCVLNGDLTTRITITGPEAKRFM